MVVRFPSVFSSPSQGINAMLQVAIPSLPRDMDLPATMSQTLRLVAAQNTSRIFSDSVLRSFWVMARL